MTELQPDLFGEVDRALDERAAWLAVFERPRMVLEWDCIGGKAGDIVAGWRCPRCGGEELGEFALSINHGFDVHRPNSGPRGDECSRQIGDRLRAEAAARNHVPDGTAGVRCPSGRLHYDRSRIDAGESPAVLRRTADHYAATVGQDVCGTGGHVFVDGAGQVAS
jgi:hypothetical protein